MARVERRFEPSPARQPFTGRGSAQGAGPAVEDAADDADDPAQPRTRQWTLDRIERIIGSIA
ncbi:MAG: hypothetical protein NXH74_03560 [Rhodobacteraceae bacterium]|jgi:hypothetical protein|nr:hypothetical protein [Paracoccaceae bacterium]